MSGPLPVKLTRRAEREIEKAGLWWRENREAAVSGVWVRGRRRAPFMPFAAHDAQ